MPSHNLSGKALKESRVLCLFPPFMRTPYTSSLGPKAGPTDEEEGRDLFLKRKKMKWIQGSGTCCTPHVEKGVCEYPPSHRVGLVPWWESTADQSKTQKLNKEDGFIPKWCIMGNLENSGHFRLLRPLKCRQCVYCDGNQGGKSTPWLMGWEKRDTGGPHVITSTFSYLRINK